MATYKKFGLIGNPLGHSLSAFIHQRIMEEAGIPGSYSLFDIPREDFDEAIVPLMRQLDGFNCTIPYKQAILPFLPELDRSARECRAVNTVYRGRGFNTDREGFRAITAFSWQAKKVLLLGAGGVARMMAWEACSQGADLTICARNASQRKALAEELRLSFGGEVREGDVSHHRYDVILNGTPLGMWPHTRQTPTDGMDLSKLFHENQTVIDTIYNPCPTKWLMQAAAAGARTADGLSMLLHQAVAAQRIWNPELEIDDSISERILPELQQQLYKQFPYKIILTGFMGSGKSTIAALLGEALSLPVIDIDREIEKASGCSIAQIFEESGEAAFREREQRVIAEVLNQPGAAVIAFGGGAILQPAVQDLCNSLPVINIFLRSSIEYSWQRIRHQNHRPLIASSDTNGAIASSDTTAPNVSTTESEGERFTKAAALLAERLPTYEKSADITIDADLDKKTVCTRILRIFGV